MKPLPLLALLLLLAPGLRAQAPAITGFSTAGLPGSTITVTGSGFGATQGSSFVSINGITAVASNWSATSLSVVVPSNALTGPLLVNVNGVQSNSVTFIVTDSLSQPLVNLGTDPRIAVATATAIEGSIVNEKGMVATVAALENQQTVDENKEAADILAAHNLEAQDIVTVKMTEAGDISGVKAAEQSDIVIVKAQEASDVASLKTMIAAIPAGPPGPPGTGGGAAPRSASAGYTVHLQASYPIGCSVFPLIVPSPGADNGLKMFLQPAGNFCDYDVNVPQDGNYVFSIRESVAATGTIPVIVHFELPPGTPAGGSISYVPTTTGWAVLSTSVVTLSAGRQVVRLMVDQTVGTGDQVNWIALTKQ
jgi:IPT/TIG domain-containing protein